jgi:hypothetical protein
VAVADQERARTGSERRHVLAPDQPEVVAAADEAVLAPSRRLRVQRVDHVALLDVAARLDAEDRVGRVGVAVRRWGVGVGRPGHDGRRPRFERAHDRAPDLDDHDAFEQDEAREDPPEPAPL